MKTEYIADANVLMSILISGKSQYINTLHFFKFYAPEFAIIELNLYKNVILEKTRLDKIQFRDFAYEVFTRINFIPEFILQENSIIRAKELCKNIDIKDTNYVALAIDMNLTLLTRDIKLQKGLNKKKFKDVMLFNDFIYNI